MSSRRIYSESFRKLVLAFDVGTTYSGISYSILDPGKVPSIKGVARFPARKYVASASKIPTIIYYDSDGKVRVVGAEAVREGIEEEAEDGNWVKAECSMVNTRIIWRLAAYFELTLCRLGREQRDIGHHLPPLPPTKTIAHIWADFLRYLFNCARQYIQDSEPNGVILWESLKNRIDFVLSHPNGWEGREQTQMRRAAVLAGLIPHLKPGHDRLSFVTEGEACLHFAIENGVLTQGLKGGVDAGGGTIDISSYRHDTTKFNRTFEEITAPQCHLYGSVFVSIHAKVFLEDFLAESPFLDDLDHIVRCFDKTTKARFRNTDEPQYIKFGSTHDNDATCNVRFGQLKLPGTKVADFFKPSAQCIIDAVSSQKSGRIWKLHVVLVGGFSASDWLFNQIREAITKFSLLVTRPENHINKAVWDGATSFYLESSGLEVYIWQFWGHFVRSAKPRPCKSKEKITGFSFWDEDLAWSLYYYFAQNTRVSETTEFKEEYYEEHPHLSFFKEIRSEVWRYKGKLADPCWKDEDPANYELLCVVSANLSKLPIELKREPGKKVYRLDLELVLKFGSTELEAQIAWKEKGVERRCPAKIVYDP